MMFLEIKNILITLKCTNHLLSLKLQRAELHTERYINHDGYIGLKVEQA